jgi:hypothetical protein
MGHIDRGSPINTLLARIQIPATWVTINLGVREHSS